jgi:hypothetical protein
MEVFADRDESVTDIEWLELCGRKRWNVLTMDRRIRYRRAEIAAIRRYAVKAFVLSSGNLRATEQANRFEDNRSAIEAACVDDGPFVYAIRADGILRIFPP